MRVLLADRSEGTGSRCSQGKPVKNEGNHSEGEGLPTHSGEEYIKKNSERHAATWSSRPAPTTTDRGYAINIKKKRFGRLGWGRPGGLHWNIAFDIWIGNDFSHELISGPKLEPARPWGHGRHDDHRWPAHQVWRAGSVRRNPHLRLVTLLAGKPRVSAFRDVRAWVTLTTTWQGLRGEVDTNGTCSVHLHGLLHSTIASPFGGVAS